MKYFYRLSLSLLLLTVCKGLVAQIDPHFTQYYVYPSWLNPALTGAFDGDYRISGIYRNQWGNVSAPFSTPGISVDFAGNKNLNYGVSALNQTAGNGGYRYLTAYGSLAYTGVRFGANGNQRVVFGMQAGLINRRFDRSKFTFGDQYNPTTGYNPSNPTMDIPTINQSMVLDIGAGVLYYDAQPGKKANFYGGFSVAHLNQPEDAFVQSAKEKLPMRFTGHAGVRLLVSDVLSITPNVMYARQGTAEEKMVGAYAQLRATENTELLLGANMRLNDAISPYVGFYHKNMVLGVSYDITTSDLGKIARSASSFEISLSFIGRRSVSTPEQNFICPRL
ncbi:PorP/SprF family type IX secretion system membrane protein [Aridibaculum aurantiacum]|uniref:PorP/SprF family type IX secretion system membrane protein n=1 Tax=Aridibaculum aurantiacum TaxID=2810307 RepID=UPI001A96C102|nr:PorP/SprF family type IX secretion system membrane protein [Aridibaculum aurantiacum]